MLIAALSYSVMGLSVHALGEDSWSMALLARALFGLPFAFWILQKNMLLRRAY